MIELNFQFARSPIHDWGLYAMEKITMGEICELVIEDVGKATNVNFRRHMRLRDEDVEASHVWMGWML